jgi:hypothetical protein
VSFKTNHQLWNQGKWPNNREACEEIGAEWLEMSHDDYLNNVDYPVCGMTSFSRVNHLGNSMDDEDLDSSNAWTDDAGKTYLPASANANRFVWTIPEIPTADDDYFTAGMEESYKSCTLRLRYNISTSDYPQWPADAMEPAHPWAGMMVDASNNTRIHQGQLDENNTPLIQDPYVYTGPGDVGKDPQFVSMAANTNQYGRTFQDRSYKFAIKKRPTTAVAKDDYEDAPTIPTIANNARVFNVNVRGKRGNIVQTYPSVEYDFVPNRLAVDSNDYVHFQWTGSDYNPRRGCNNGEGGPPDPNEYVLLFRILPPLPLKPSPLTLSFLRAASSRPPTPTRTAAPTAATSSS